MRNLAIALLAVVLAACPSKSPTPRDPITIGRTLGALSCTIAVAEKPEIKAPLALALAGVKTALESDSPSLSAISTALASVTDPKVRTYAGGTVALVLAIFPDLTPSADAALPQQARDAILAAIAACNPVLGVTTTTSTSSTTTTEPEPTSTSTAPEPSTTSTTTP